jgi:hypothetical protein
MVNILFIHSLAVVQLGGFHSLAIVNSDAINIGRQVTLLHVDSYSRNMPKSGMAGS